MSIFLSGIHEKLADIALVSNEYDTAVKELKTALYYAAAMDQAQTAGKQKYTCLILDHYDYDYSDCRSWGSYTKDLQERICENKKYDPIRERDDFKDLFD